ncbi:MAG: sulfurtransferase [Saprospiraceae bacterium]|nr:sulfurtransferase [Saprospiraceae bacterium]
MRGFIILITLFISSCSLTETTEKTSPYLLNPDEVQDLLSTSKGVKIIELSNYEQYIKGHLNNAYLLERKDYADTTHVLDGMMASKSHIESLLQRMAVQANDTLILYGEQTNVDACRFFWILKCYGHPSVFIMDGGKKAWSEYYPLDTMIKDMPIPGKYKFPTGDNPMSQLAEIEDVLRAVQDEDIQIIDTRSSEEYSGEPFVNKGKVVHWKSGAVINGTIPTAKHIHWTRLQSYEEPFGFKSKKDIIHELEKDGIDPYGEMILFCQSGARSSHTFFALKYILGNNKVKNYDGSWIEWSARYATNPKMIRQISAPAENDRILSKLKQEMVNNNG